MDVLATAAGGLAGVEVICRLVQDVRGVPGQTFAASTFFPFAMSENNTHCRKYSIYQLDHGKALHVPPGLY